MQIKKKLTPYLENIAESGAACLLTMVQGNILVLGVSHWITASQTGLIAGTATATAIGLARSDNRVVIATILGAVTAVVDYFVHPGEIGEWAVTEPLITGLGAAVLSYTLGTFVLKYREQRAARAVRQSDH